MKNYYAEFLQNKNVNTLESEVSKVSKGHTSTENAAFDTFDTSSHRVNQKNFIAETLTAQLNAMFPGASAAVAIGDFQITSADELTDAQKDFISVNRVPILCTLQQSLLVRHLFSHSPERLEDFAFSIMERESLLSMTAKTNYEVYVEAVKQTTKFWFEELLQNG